MKSKKSRTAKRETVTCQVGDYRIKIDYIKSQDVEGKSKKKPYQRLRNCF